MKEGLPTKSHSKQSAKDFEEVGLMYLSYFNSQNIITFLTFANRAHPSTLDKRELIQHLLIK